MPHKSLASQGADERRKRDQQIISAQGGTKTIAQQRAASAGPMSAVYKMTKAHSDAAKRQRAMLKRRDAAKKKLQIIERQIKSARKAT